MSDWTDSFYTNAKLMEAEEKLLRRFESNWHPMTMKEMMELTGLSDRSMRRVFMHIRRYSGYEIEVTKRQNIIRWQVIYKPELDPWLSFAGVKYASQV